MSIWLVMRTNDGGERPFLLEKVRTIVGRETRCDVRIAVPTVDDRHCELVLDGDQVTIRDLGSSTGTLHNGSPVEQAVLAHDDTVTVGPVTFVVRVEPGPAPKGAAAPEV